ncbi:unnamed protein product, partial [marine sediment metagenome]
MYFEAKNAFMRWVATKDFFYKVGITSKQVGFPCEELFL